MDSDGLRPRHLNSDPQSSNYASKEESKKPHPSNRTKPSLISQYTRAGLFSTYFLACCISIHITQFLGAPLYFFNKDWYYSWMAYTKQNFGTLLVSGTRIFSPTAIRVSGDSSVSGQLKLSKDGLLETNFPERLLLIANHQLYPEWAYLWWIAYTSRMHGHIFIILKESLKYIPMLGPGMMFYGFIFMARKWATDQSRMAHRLKQLASHHGGPLTGTQALDPMWLLIFPEGTNLSGNTRKHSAKWSEKSGIPDFKHQLLPRTTGLQFALSKLNGSIDWVYDCTLAYEGIPEGGYAQDHYTLRSTYLEGRPPRVNMYWRRFAVSSIPVDDQKAFEQWLLNVWREKEALLDHFSEHGKFPASEEATVAKKSANGTAVGLSRQGGYIETQLRLSNWIEIGQIFVGVGAVALIGNVVVKLVDLFSKIHFF